MRLNPGVLAAPGQYLPATASAILEWAAFLGKRGLQPKTIKGYISSIRSLHVDAGLPFDVCESPTLQRLIRGIKRFHGEKARQPKLPITLDIFQRLVAVSGDLNQLFNAEFDAASKTAWSGFFRCGEVTVPDNGKFDPSIHLTRGSVEFLPSFENATHVRITLPASKTDPFRKGITILIAKVAAETCAVTALQHLFRVNPQPSTAPLFSNGAGAPLTRKDFIATLKSRLASIGLDASGYSGHSFRRGAATSAAIAGYSDYEIQLLGRWRSDAYRLYLDVPQHRIIHLSSRLHWASAPAQPFEPPALPFASPVA